MKLINYYCIDCKKEISKNAKRCKSCAQSGKLNSMYERKRPDIIKRNRLNKGKQNNHKHNCVCSWCKAKKGYYKGFNNPNFGNGDKIKGIKNPMWNKQHTKSTKEKMRKKSLLNWGNKSYRIKQLIAIMSGNIKIPNNLEIKLLKLFKKLKLLYKYVGNGKFWISYKNNCFNPDFIDIKHKKIIELFGNYWHNLLNVKQRDKIRINTYKKRGYKVLIIWGKELKNINKLIKKLRKFTNV